MLASNAHPTPALLFDSPGLSWRERARMLRCLFEELSGTDPGTDRLGEVERELAAVERELAPTALPLLSCVMRRTRVFCQRLASGAAPWSTRQRQSLIELACIVDRIVDVVELVGTDGGCQTENRDSLRILASTDPSVLLIVDRMTRRDCRFHQACGYRAKR